MKELAIVLRPADPFMVCTPVEQNMEELQLIVGGWVEQIRISEGVTFLVNEEPAYNSPINAVATLLAANYGRAFPEGIRGTVIVFGKPHVDGWKPVPGNVLGVVGEIMRQIGVLDDLPK